MADGKPERRDDDRKDVAPGVPPTISLATAGVSLLTAAVMLGVQAWAPESLKDEITVLVAACVPFATGFVSQLTRRIHLWMAEKHWAGVKRRKIAQVEKDIADLDKLSTSHFADPGMQRKYTFDQGAQEERARQYRNAIFPERPWEARLDHKDIGRHPQNADMQSLQEAEKKAAEPVSVPVPVPSRRR